MEYTSKWFFAKDEVVVYKQYASENIIYIYSRNISLLVYYHKTM